MLSEVATRGRALRLYRRLLRYSGQLHLTDRHYFYNRVRAEFVQHRSEVDPDRINFLLQRGEALLSRGRVI